MRSMEMRSIIVAFVCAWGACSASAYSFKVKVDPRDPSEKKEVSLYPWTVELAPNSVETVTIESEGQTLVIRSE